MAVVMTSPLVEPIAQAFAAEGAGPRLATGLAEIATDAVLAVVAALPADYTGTDILAALRGEDVPSEPLPAKADEGDVLLAAIITHAAEALRVADEPDGAA